MLVALQSLDNQKNLSILLRAVAIFVAVKEQGIGHTLQALLERLPATARSTTI